MKLTPGHAVLRLTGRRGSFTFLLPKELTGLYKYSATYEPLPLWQIGEIPASKGMYWDGGKAQPVSLSLELLVGASPEIDTPDCLMKITEALVSIGHPSTESTGPQKPPEIIQLQVGTWFNRKAVVTGTGVDFGRPWDPETGKPLKATVMLSLQFVYDVLPSSASFTWGI